MAQLINGRNMKNIIQELKSKSHPHVLGALDIFRYIGPGLLVTVGFIDPGNWATNFAAGSSYGYALLWVVTLSTWMLVALQHNVAHLGIVTGLCLSEATVNTHHGGWVVRSSSVRYWPPSPHRWPRFLVQPLLLQMLF